MGKSGSSVLSYGADHFFPNAVVSSGNLDKQTALGNTALHYCGMYSKPECLKLLLRSKPTVDVGEYGQGSLLSHSEGLHWRSRG